MNISGAQVLSKEEQKNLVGGIAFTCSCNNGGGAWTANYGSIERSQERAAYWCGEGGGTCKMLEQAKVE